MKKNKWIVLFLAALLTLFMAVNVLAMTSSGYALEWYVPVTSAGGGEASSANYAVNMTVGQSVIGPSSSPPTSPISLPPRHRVSARGFPSTHSPTTVREDVRVHSLPSLPPCTRGCDARKCRPRPRCLIASLK